MRGFFVPKNGLLPLFLPLRAPGGCLFFWVTLVYNGTAAQKGRGTPWTIASRLCDDEPQARELAQACAVQWAHKHGYSVEVRQFPTGDAFLFQYEEDKAWDIQHAI